MANPPAGTERHPETKNYLPPVSSEDLASARAKKTLDPAAPALMEAEREYIAVRRAKHDLANGVQTAALALSGGGIRSAAFALGVMQRLAAADYLRVFDYLSTVSGGGFIGSSLTWLTSKPFYENSDWGPKGPICFGIGPADPSLPYGADDPSSAETHDPSRPVDQFLTYLRSHGQYLMPGGGITLVSGIAVVLRGILLNLLVWLPIAAVLAALMVSFPPSWVPDWVPSCLGNHFVCFAVGGENQTLAQYWLPSGFAWGLILAAVPWAAFVLFSVVYSIFTYFPGSVRYRGRRLFETFGHWALLWAIGLTIVATIPWAAQLLSAKGGIAFLLSGMAGGLGSFFKSRGDGNGKVPPGLLASVAALLLCYGFLVLAFEIGTWSYDAAVLLAPPIGQRWVLVLALIPSIVVGSVVNLNYLTLHHYYRDRLMEAFMPDIDMVRRNQSGAARKANSALLSQMCDKTDARGPYHLINTNLILTDTSDKTRKTRGGDSFVLSPRYCGSNATGWRATTQFLGGVLTLPTAMAISGAAANPDAGSGGVGVTRNPIVSVVMALLNVRLGYWIANPNPARASTGRRPNHFEPGVFDIVDWKRNENSWTLRLSDGGHFDNLGLYELIRRRVEFIVVSDAGADPDYAFADLTNAIVRVEQDFGARIVFDDNPALHPLLPSVDLVFPRNERKSERSHARAKIKYADGTEGTLLYVTTVLTEGLRLKLLGYLSANPSFPDESTADQFFSEAQFEAYRELGYVATEQMLQDTARDDQGNTVRDDQGNAVMLATEFTRRLKPSRTLPPPRA
jgi:predicted acylesterase/phospholipase RssA